LGGIYSKHQNFSHVRDPENIKKETLTRKIGTIINVKEKIADVIFLSRVCITASVDGEVKELQPHS
jgi:hypothetical protein